MIMKSFFLITIGLLSFIGCKEEIVDNPTGNKSPETGIFLYPDTSVSSQPSRVKLAWWGDDPDGLLAGFFFSWNGVNWTFTSKNDSTFELQVGITDTLYKFRVASADQHGNGIYDATLMQNGINFGSEPFTDKNGNGIWDANEPFVDIGLIDPSPAEIILPIRNSAPTIEWNSLTIIPDTSFPVMSFGWNAADIDGDESIAKINIALNDTANSANVLSIPGATRVVTLRVTDFSSPNPLAEILIEGSTSNIFSEKLKGMLLDSENKFFVQAEDISGAKSPFISLPGSGAKWFVQKPKGKLLIVDDYTTNDEASTFYNLMMDSLNLSGKYDIYNFRAKTPPYLNVTFLETIKLFKYVLWYGDNNPSIDLAAGSVQKYIDAGGKILMSTLFPQNIDIGNIQGFLSMIKTDSSGYRDVLMNGTLVSDSSNIYPPLETKQTIFRSRSFYLNEIGTVPIYNFPNNELPGYIGFSDTQKKIFFIGLPLHRCNNGSANVKQLLNKVLLQDFGLTP